MSPSTRLKASQPTSSIPTWTRHGGASRPSRHALTVTVVAARTITQVARWKKPSASVFASRPSIVVAGWSPVAVST
jgi:hypothetical protein